MDGSSESLRLRLELSQKLSAADQFWRQRLAIILKEGHKNCLSFLSWRPSEICPFSIFWMYLRGLSCGVPKFWVSFCSLFQTNFKEKRAPKLNVATGLPEYIQSIFLWFRIWLFLNSLKIIVVVSRKISKKVQKEVYSVSNLVVNYMAHLPTCAVCGMENLSIIAQHKSVMSLRRQCKFWQGKLLIVNFQPAKSLECNNVVQSNGQKETFGFNPDLLLVQFGCLQVHHWRGWVQDWECVMVHPVETKDTRVSRWGKKRLETRSIRVL